MESCEASPVIFHSGCVSSATFDGEVVGRRDERWYVSEPVGQSCRRDAFLYLSGRQEQPISETSTVDFDRLGFGCGHGTRGRGLELSEG